MHKKGSEDNLQSLYSGYINLYLDIIVKLFEQNFETCDYKSEKYMPVKY